MTIKLSSYSGILILKTKMAPSHIHLPHISVIFNQARYYHFSCNTINHQWTCITFEWNTHSYRLSYSTYFVFQMLKNKLMLKEVCACFFIKLKKIQLLALQSKSGFILLFWSITHNTVNIKYMQNFLGFSFFLVYSKFLNCIFIGLRM